MGTKVRNVERWWNGSFGRLARRDIWLRTTDDDGRWDVWIRDGGTEGRNSHTEYETEQEARTALQKLINGQPQSRWRKMPT